MKTNLSNFAGVSLSLTCLILFATCAKEYSNEGGGKKNTAVYTLVGAGDSCTGSVLTGGYYPGTTLAAFNTVQLQVNVTTVGQYSLGTNTADGFRFSSSGTFTNTGLQTITLIGNGTPAATGPFSFTASAAGAGCRFTVNVVKKPVIMASLMLAGDPGDCQNPAVNGSYTAGVALTAANSVVVIVNVASAGAYTINTDTLDGISFTASGTFTTTGSRTVMLSGTGTPNLARNLVFTTRAGNSNCTFKLPIADPAPLAVYVLESGYGSSSPCTGYTIGGSYAAGIPLSAANVAGVKIYVTVPGNFTICTDTVNGMVFSFSGNLANTGEQTVTLTGSGTPATSGAFSLNPQIVGAHPLGGEACGITVRVQ